MEETKQNAQNQQPQQESETQPQPQPQPQQTQTVQQPAQAQTVQPEQPKKKKTWKWVLLGCGGCFLCILLAVGGVLAIGGYGFYKAYDAVKAELGENNPLCQANTDDEYREIYTGLMTQEYQDQNSYQDFKEMMEDNDEVFSDCELLLPEFKDLFTKGVEVTTEEGGDTTLSFSKEKDDKTVDIEVIISPDGGFEINDLEVTD